MVSRSTRENIPPENVTTGPLSTAGSGSPHAASLSLASVLGRNSAVLVGVFALGVAASQFQRVVPRIGVVHMERAALGAHERALRAADA